MNHNNLMTDLDKLCDANNRVLNGDATANANKPIPLLDDRSTQTESTKMTNGSNSENNFDDEPSVPDDNAAYLQKELQDRVQNEPALFEWIQKAALDGMWYVIIRYLLLDDDDSWW